MAARGKTTVHAGSNERLARRVLAVCDAVGEFISYWGFKAIHGRIWTLLALSRVPLSQAQLGRTLGVSRSLVSGSVADLERLGLVRPTHAARNAPYIAVADVWPTIADVLRTREWMLIESARLALEAALDEARGAERDGERIAYDAERIAVLLAMTEVAHGFVKMLLRIRSTPAATELLGGWVSRAAQLVRKLRR